MGEFSKNTFTEGMRFRERTRVERVRLILQGLTAHVISEPFPAMSDHFKPAEPLQAAQELPQLKTELNRWDEHIVDL